MIDDTVLDMSLLDLLNFQEELFENEQKVDLILLLDKLTYDAISSWRQTKDIPEEQIANIREQHLLPAISKLGQLCVGAIRFRDEVTYSEGIERLGRIYNLGRFRDLGNPRGTEDPKSAEPSIHSIIQLYVIGSYAMFRGRMSYFRPILDLSSLDWRNQPVPLLSDPHWSHWSNYDSQPNRFQGALKLITETPRLFGLFFDDTSEVKMALCQFDLLASFSVWRHQGRAFVYFTDCPKAYLNPIIESLLKSEIAAVIFGAFEPEQLASFLWSKDLEARHLIRGAWQASDWSPAVQQFLQQHPPREGAR